MADNADLIRFVQRAVGYSLTGDVREQVFFILWGDGRNGKSTFIETIMHLLGPYAGVIPKQTLTASRVEPGIRNDVMKLQGLRFGTSSEIEMNSRLNESMLKDLTGGDTVTGRFLYSEHIDFQPQVKIWIRTNYKPRILGTDEGIWRRVRLIPFNVRFEGAKDDKGLKDRIWANELPGVLAWAVRGAVEWSRAGLEPPQDVVAATAEYRKDENQVQQFVDECCKAGPDEKIVKPRLYEHYTRWARSSGYRFLLTQQQFKQQLFKAAEVRQERKSGQDWYLGITVVGQLGEM
jgi:putative DNA primase/helicase